MKLSEKAFHFLAKQHFLIISTLDEKGLIHCSAKGVVFIEDEKIYLADVYLNRTFKNLKKNKNVSLTAVDEAKFTGYTLQGEAKIVPKENVASDIVDKWEKRMIERITKRVISGVRSGAKSSHHEARLPPHLKYLIEVEIQKVIDLSPPSANTSKRD